MNNLSIIQEYFQSKVGRKMRILQPGLEKHHSPKKKERVFSEDAEQSC